jgi:predicted DCC family thiol-disulfide oxidoreductase YuxK
LVNHNQPDESLRARSDGVRYVLGQLGRFWRFAGSLLSWLPRPPCDWGYRVIVRNRYRIFGRYDACPLPSKDVRGRFLDL